MEEHEPCSHFQRLTDRLTAFSSEKIALCLPCGLPVVAFAYEDYECLRQERGGVLINPLAELPQAVLTILQLQGECHLNAITAFRRHFAFERSVVTLRGELSRLPQGGRTGRHTAAGWGLSYSLTRFNPTHAGRVTGS